MPLSPRPVPAPPLASTATPTVQTAVRLPARPAPPRRGTAAARETSRFGEGVRERAQQIAAEHEEQDHYERVPLSKQFGINMPAVLDDARAKQLPGLSASRAYGQPLHRLASTIVTDPQWVRHNAEICQAAMPALEAERGAQRQRERERRAVRNALARGADRAEQLIAQLLSMPGDGPVAEPQGEMRIVRRGEDYALDPLPQPGGQSRRVTIRVAGDTFWMIQHVGHPDNLNAPLTALAIISLWGMPYYLKCPFRPLAERETVARHGMLLRAVGGLTALGAEVHRCDHCGHISLEH